MQMIVENSPMFKSIPHHEQTMKAVQQDIVEKAKIAAKGTPLEACSMDLDFIEVPSITVMGSSITPHPVNGITTSMNSVALPDPMIPSFKSYLDQELKRRGINSTFIDMLGSNNNTSPTHYNKAVFNGNLHCGTYVMHLCQKE